MYKYPHYVDTIMTDNENVIKHHIYKTIIIKSEDEIPYWKQVMEMHGWKFEYYSKNTKTLYFTKA